ncbi:hypothetical protein BRD15_02655 [Halobacteriales archaeon SW_6_65_15]|nr:MAG: hypothetical protein BRD15_02655 [Halobacteriales archaeon SW_6_65_15]
MPREPSADSEFADSTRGTTPDKPVHLEDGDDLDAFVAEHDLVLVDLYTEGCTLCQAIEPVVGNVARATEAVVEFVASRGEA